MRRGRPQRLPTVTVYLGSRYRLEEVIGRGGMASVWRATDTVLERPVAVKRLHGRLLDDPDHAERFRREARLAARLDHPGIVKLLDRGDDEQGPYLVYELVEGETLKARVAGAGGLEPRAAARICAQVARALDYAHRRGVVHRDITAGNILLTPDGHAKLTDFGVARAAEAEAGLTHTGALLGTTEYVSPEQAQGHPVDGRSDIYSLGVVLYECLTGELPFTGEGALAVAVRHLNEEVPDPRARAPGTPPALAEAVLTATAKDPERRFADAGRFAEVLEAAAAGSDTAVLPRIPVDTETTGRLERPARARARWIVGAGAVVALAAAGVAAVRLGVVAWPGGRAAAPADLAPLPIARVVDWDPEGDGSELPGDVPLAWDGDPATAWQTERYFDTGELSRHAKSGVGLRITLERPAAAREMVVWSRSAGAVVEVRGGDETSPLGAATLRGGRQAIPLEEGPPRSDYVLWFTRLPADAGPLAAFVPAYRGSVGEVELRGPAKGD
jgi:serine/threonine-protein kinase